LAPNEPSLPDRTLQKTGPEAYESIAEHKVPKIKHTIYK
jgi:hypothetical protein